MTILDKIVEHKKQEIALAKQRVSIKELMYFRHFNQHVPSLKDALTNPSGTGIISEFKRQSPSKGIINNTAKVDVTTKGYEQAGVSALSVLTDAHFFGGRNEDLTTARDATSLSILRKDFIIDPFQVYEAKAIGASAILLIAAILTKEEAIDLGSLANYLGMEVLMEIHDESEIEKINIYVDMVGINNRNLKTFEVDLQHSVRLAQLLPANKPKVAESGIHSVTDLRFLKTHGFNGFLIGEQFMKTVNPGMACQQFISEINTTTNH